MREDDELFLPDDQDAERGLIATVAGALLMGEAAGVEAIGAVRPEQFIAPQHQAVWSAMQQVHLQGVAFDALTVKAELERRGKLGTVGGYPGLVELFAGDDMVTPGPLVARILEVWWRRELMKVASGALRAAADMSADPSDILNTVQEGVINLQQTQDGPLEILDPALWANTEPPPIRFLIKGLLPWGVPCIWAGKSNSGKSMGALQASMAVAAGRGIFGLEGPGQPLKVIFVPMEDDRSEIHRRFRRCLSLFREEPDWSDQQEAALLSNWRASVPIWTSSTLKTLTAIKGVLVKQAADLCRDGGQVGLIVLDTFAALSEGEENRAEVQQAFWANCNLLAEKTGATPLVIHHVRKQNMAGKGPSMAERLSFDNLRGSSAIVAGARGIIQTEPLSADEATRLQLDEDRAMAGNYIILALTKLNGGPKGAWMALEQREAGEIGAGFFTPMNGGDQICAALKSKRAAAKLTQAEGILLDLAGRMTPEDVAAKYWPGIPEAKAKRKFTQALYDLKRRHGWLQADGSTLNTKGFEKVQELRRQIEDVADISETKDVGGDTWPASA